MIPINQFADQHIGCINWNDMQFVPRQVRDSISIVVFNIGNCMHFTSNQIPE
jgi:hypothetical protein